MSVTKITVFSDKKFDEKFVRNVKFQSISLESTMLLVGVMLTFAATMM